jgi:peroxiredoxin
MKMFKKVIVIFFASLLWLPVSYAETAKGAAPNFTLKSRSGENLKLSEYRGDVVLVNFWASWCGPCRKEMPKLEELYQKYKNLGFNLLAVNVEEDSSKANDFLKDLSVTFPILYDNENKVSKLYKVSAMPSTVIIDRDGNVRFVHHGYLVGYENDYSKEIKELIEE